MQEKVREVYSQLGGRTYQGCKAPDRGFFWKTDASAMARILHEVIDAVQSAP